MLKIVIISAMGYKEKKHSDKKDNLLHIVMGFVILVHGMGHLDKHVVSGIIFMLVGVIFISCAIFHKKLINRFPYIDIVFHILEGLLAIVVAASYFQENKKFIPYFYILAGLLYFNAAFMHLRRTKKHSMVETPPEPGDLNAATEISENIQILSLPGAKVSKTE